MEIQREQLMDVLLKVKPGLADKEMIEQSTHFIFDDNTVRTYNDKITITHTFESELQGAVSAQEFYNLFNKIPDEKIKATDKGDGKFVFKGKNKQITFRIDPEIMIPKVNVAALRSKKWMPLPKDFAESIKFCVFSASKNMMQLYLTGVLVKEGTAVSCDNFRGTKVKMKAKVKKPFLIPASTVVDLANYNPTKYYIDGSWIHFVNAEKTIFSCRCIDETYPDGIFDIFRVKGKRVSLPEEFVDVLERSKTVISDDLDFDKNVTITLKGGWINSVGEGAVAKIEEKTATKYDGKGLTVVVQPDLIIEIMKHLKEVVIGEGHLLFKGKNIDHVILLASDEDE